MSHSMMQLSFDTKFLDSHSLFGALPHIFGQKPHVRFQFLSVEWNF